MLTRQQQLLPPVHLPSWNGIRCVRPGRGSNPAARRCLLVRAAALYTTTWVPRKASKRVQPRTPLKEHRPGTLAAIGYSHRAKCPHQARLSDVLHPRSDDHPLVQKRPLLKHQKRAQWGGHVHCALVAACGPEACGATFEVLRENSQDGVGGRLTPLAILRVFRPEHGVIKVGPEELARRVLRHPQLLIHATNLCPWAACDKSRNEFIGQTLTEEPGHCNVEKILRARVGAKLTGCTVILLKAELGTSMDQLVAFRGRERAGHNPQPPWQHLDNSACHSTEPLAREAALSGCCHGGQILLPCLRGLRILGAIRGFNWCGDSGQRRSSFRCCSLFLADPRCCTVPCQLILDGIAVLSFIHVEDQLTEVCVRLHSVDHRLQDWGDLVALPNVHRGIAAQLHE
mmetsp:Transcript_103872/g.323755  ORF Transcript_103872/g.323755 Transcript_103872/m.323755 type:complete len:400 (-) Transcript_103872:1048-2247(-)